MREQDYITLKLREYTAISRWLQTQGSIPHILFEVSGLSTLQGVLSMVIDCGVFFYNY